MILAEDKLIWHTPDENNNSNINEETRYDNRFTDLSAAVIINTNAK
jgi:hypothetical protein